MSDQRVGLCRDCPIGCHTRKGVKKNKLAAYAALWGLDRDAQEFGGFVADYHRLCDDIGLEAFETAAAIATGLAAGLVTAGFNGILAALGEISRGTELGLILGEGAQSAGQAWGILPSTEAGPRKSAGRSEAEDIFLDSVGLCAYAYSVMLNNPDLWAALEDLLKAKYGPSFDSEKLKKLALDAARLEKS